MGDVTKTKRINIRVSDRPAARVAAMAAALTDDDTDTTESAVYRKLLGEALTARTRDCARAHRGPIRSDRCGHCGGQA